MDNSEKEDLSDIPLSWIIEEAMLEDYFLLVRRIKGMGLSLDDYWQMDSWSTAKLLSMERAIIDEEIKSNPDYKNKYEERPEGNSEEMNDLVDEMSIEE